MKKYAYVRVSTLAQEESGVGMLAQELTTKRLGESIAEDWGMNRFPQGTRKAGYFVDVTSASSNPFFARPAGKALLNTLDDGDTIVMTRLDRGFRSVADFCNFLSLAKTYNWNLVCADPPIDLKTPNGRMFATFLAMMAQWESEIKSERIKEALAAKKERNARRAKAKATTETSVSVESDYRPSKAKVMRSEHRVQKGRVFVYIRCSHRSSVESGLGLRYQMTKCCEYADALVKEYPQLTFNDTIVTDPAESCWKTGFASRPQGGKLHAQLQKGDTIVCLRPDRVFGSIRDMSEVLQDWKKRGVKVHFAEGGMNLDTAFGEMVLSVMVAFSEMERTLASARAKDSRAALESQGKFTGGTGYPYFWMGYKNGGVRKLILDRRQIVTFRLIEFLRRQGLNIKQALERCEELIAIREERPQIPECGVQRVGKFRSLPDYYIPNSKGVIYPMWTYIRYQSAKEHFEKALAGWREKVTEEKDALARIAERDGLHRPVMRLKKRKWKKPEQLEEPEWAI